MTFDTDSVFIKLNQFLVNQGVDIDKWNNLDRKIKIKFLLKLSKSIEKYVNNKCYDSLQIQDYNSSVLEEDFSIKLKQEIITSQMLHLGAKMYCYHVINDEGYDCDKIDAKGVEIVRSSAPKIFRNALKHILERLLKGDDDDTLSDIVDEYKSQFYNSTPEDISVNIGVNNLDKYINSDNTYLTGTPYHIKGVANYRLLLNEFGIEYKYEEIKEGDKCKVVYLKNNKYGINNLTYYNFPQEFIDSGITIDYDVMIQKYFIQKALILLNPINRGYILEDKSIEDLFF